MNPSVSKTIHKMFPVLFVLCLITMVSLAETVDRIVAKVGQDVITLSDREAYQRFKKLDFEFRFGAAASGQFANYQSRLLEDLILDRILDQELEREKINTAPTDVEAEYQSILKRLGVSHSGFLARLNRSGITLAEYKAQLRRSVGKRELIQKKIMPSIAVSELDIKREYSSHPERYGTFKKFRFVEGFFTPEKFSTEEQFVSFVKDLHQKMERGQNVSSLISQYSFGAFAAKGGDSGLVAATSLKPEIVNVLTRLKPGQVSPPVPFGEGVFLFKLLERAEPTPIPYSQINQQVRADVAEKAVEQGLQRYLMAVKDQTFVEIIK